MSSPVRIGIIGGGKISELHANGYLSSDNAIISAVADKDENVSKIRAAQWGAKRRYIDYKDLLANPEIDAVEILTPHNLHAQMVIDAIKAGKHVSVQKPMAISLTECDEMISASSASSRISRVFENFMYYPPIAKAKNILDNGDVGDPISLRIKSARGSHKYGWNVPDSSNEWRFDDKQSGGGRTIFDFGYHVFALAIHLFGEIDQVFAWIREEAQQNGQIMDSPAIISWIYKEGCKQGSWDATSSDEIIIPSDYYAEDEWIEISGTRGFIWINRCTGKTLNQPPLVLYSNGKFTEIFIEEKELDWATSFTLGVQNFVDSIVDEKKTSLTFEEGKNVYLFARGAQRASVENRPIKMAEMI